MAYQQNPQYNPNDPKSMRYINVPDAPMSAATPNMSVLPAATPAPNQSTVPMSVAPKVTAPVQNAPVPNMSAAPPALTTLPNYDALKPNTDTAVKSSTLFGTAPAKPENPYTAINGNPGQPAPAAPTAPPTYTPPADTGNYIPGLDDAQRNSITNLVNSNRAFSETDAKNYAFATGAGDYRQFIGKTGSQITGVGSQGGTANPTGDGLDTTPNPSNPNGMSDRDLAIAAGRAGVSIDDYIAAVQGKNPQSAEEYDAIRNRLGIPGLLDEAYKKPQKSTVDVYNEFYNLSGLDSVKQKISAIDEEIAQKRRDLVTATGELQNNPWLSQATRTGRLRILTQLAEQDINNSLLNRQQYLDQYNDGVSKVEEYVKRNVYDQGQERDLNVDKLNYLLSEAERQDKAGQAKTKAQALRYLPDYLTSKADNSTQFNTGSIQEYRFYEQQERAAGRTPISYDEYQTMDANRKARAVNGGPASLLTPAQFADAARKGYVSDQQLALYANIAAGGGVIPNLKAPTEAQGKALGFYDRTKTANDTLTNLQTEFNGILARGGVLPNFLKSDNRQVFEQGERNFINALLRRESGAAISPEEFASARQQYIPQPGDGAAVLESKRINRQSAINSLKTEAGNLVDEAPQQQTLQSFYQQNPDKQAGIEDLMRQGKTDEEISQILGFNQPPSMGQNRSVALAQTEKKYPEGSKGGQCGIFAHKIVDFPPIGDAKSEKFASVDKFGIPAAKWRQSPQVGDVIITDESKQYGHVAVVNAILPDGSLRLTESNFRGKESVSHDRTLPINSSKIYGAFRGKLKA